MTITGLLSDGICSFNAAWQKPDRFSRVISWIGNYTSIQRKEDTNLPDDGQDYPRKSWPNPGEIFEGSQDQENERYGSWPLANIRLANALKLKGYDFHLNFGKGTHNSGQGAAEFPEEMIWLWHDCDPAKTEQTYEMDPAEKATPVFRVSIRNRAAE